MKQLARAYGQFVRGVLELPNARYSAQEHPWYVVVVLSVPVCLLLMGGLTFGLRQFEQVPPHASLLRENDSVVVVVLVYGLAFALHYWLVFHNCYVRTLVLPNHQNYPRRVRFQLIGFFVSAFLLFVLTTSWHRLFPT